MSLLSRVAERLYWMARYMERAEATARVTQAYSHLVMDIPEGTAPGWDVLVGILDAEPVFEAHYRAYNEQNVLRFLIADEHNPGSVRLSIKAARENVRTTRDVLPAELWEHINELYLYAEEHADKSVGRRHRYQFLEEVINRAQIIAGLVITTMYRDSTYRFLALGHLLERADMTTRIIDVGAGVLMNQDQPNPAIDTLLWASQLQSLSALSTYRRRVGPIPEAASVVEFMLKEAELPRSLAFCLAGMRADLERLHQPERALKQLAKAQRRLSRFDPEEVSWAQLHEFIDQLQLELNALNSAIQQTWFQPELS